MKRNMSEFCLRNSRLFRVTLFGCLLLCVIAIATNARSAEFINGQLLVATEDMGDPRFAEAVIYMVKHDLEGAFGLIINRPLAKGPIHDLLQGFGIEVAGAKGEIIIHYGGPVNTDAAFVLHSDDVLLDESKKVKDGIAMTAKPKLIEEMARGKGPHESMVIFGYSGWAPGQLEDELQAGAWHVIPADRNLVFGKDDDKKWREATARRRISL
jgi:putative transcriptional regulator